MPPPLSISAVAPALREQLDARLRANGYSEFVALSAWMRDQGHAMGKSSIHRYALRLRKVDAKDRIGIAAVLETPATKAPKRGRLRGTDLAGDQFAVGEMNSFEKALILNYRQLSSKDQSDIYSRVEVLASSAQRNLAI